MPQRICADAPGVARYHVAPTSGCPAKGSSAVGVKMRTGTTPSSPGSIDEDRLRVAELPRHVLHVGVGEQTLMDPEVVAAPRRRG